MRRNISANTLWRTSPCCHSMHLKILCDRWDSQLYGDVQHHILRPWRMTPITLFMRNGSFVLPCALYVKWPRRVREIIDIVLSCKTLRESIVVIPVCLSDCLTRHCHSIQCHSPDFFSPVNPWTWYRSYWKYNSTTISQCNLKVQCLVSKGIRFPYPDSCLGFIDNP